MRPILARLRQPGWRRWGQVLLMGVVLGLLQLLDLWATATFSQKVIDLDEGFLRLLIDWWPFVVPGVLLYLLIPALAGFLASRQSGDASSARNAGCLVGMVSFIVLVIAVLVGLALAPPTPSCAPNCRLGAGVAAQAAVGVIITFFIILEGIASTVGGLLGGAIGGLLGQRYAAALNQRSRTAGEHTP